MSTAQPAPEDFLALLSRIHVMASQELRSDDGHEDGRGDASPAGPLTETHISAALRDADRRIETVIIESLKAGIADQRVQALFQVLGWQRDFDCFTVAGTPQPGFEAASIRIRNEVRDLGGRHCIVSHDGSICIALVAIQAAVRPEATCTALLPAFDDSAPVCLGPARHNPQGAAQSVIAAVTALSAAPAISPVPYPMRADDVLPERALLGDAGARDELYDTVYASLRGDNPDDPTLTTVSTFLMSGSSLDITARELNVHPNTVRYRLKRASETTGWDATDPREAYVLHTAITLGRIRDAQNR